MLTRKIDVLGRITLPKEIRDNLGMEIGQALIIESDNEKITLYKPKKEEFTELLEEARKVLNKVGADNSMYELLEKISNKEELAKIIVYGLLNDGSLR